MNLAHIHKANDGRGARDVFVDGNLVTGVVYADTQKGFVSCLHTPIKLTKNRKRTLKFTLKGNVEVREKGLNRG